MVDNFLGKIKNLLLYGGTDKDTYKKIQEHIYSGNRIGTIVFSITAFMAMVIAFVMSLFYPDVADNQMAFVVVAIIQLAIIITNIINKDKGSIVDFTVYIYIITMFSFGLYTAVVTGRNVQTTAFMVLLTVVPMLFMVKPIIINSLIILFDCLYVFLGYHLMEPSLFGRNLINAVIYGFLSIITNTFITVIKIDRNKHGMESHMAAKSKSDFLSNMSHEIRTPINTVLGMNEMILRETDDSNIEEYSLSIKTAGQILLSLVNDILDYSKMESGNMSLIFVQYSLSDILNNVNILMAQRMQEKGLLFTISVDENIPNEYIGDDVRIRQILINLLSNALKYTENGRVELNITGKVDDGYAALHVEVKDTGIGIKEENLSRLKEAFVRVDETRNRSIEGTGLGISIVEHLLKLMNSTLCIESEYGKGSIFSFDIRQLVTDDSPIGSISLKLDNQPKKEEYAATFTAKDAWILVVDDNPMNLNVFTSLLKETKCNVDTADGGKVAVKKAEDKKYDLIFMDHMMPEMDGIEAFHIIREGTGPNKDTPIYVLTANAIAGAKSKYLEEGFDGYVTKPIEPERLERTIKRALPKDKVKKGEKKEKKRIKKVSIDYDSLPVVEGLDWNYGMSHVNDLETLKKTICDFASFIKSETKILENLYLRIVEGDEKAIEEFRVKVHSLKSTTTLVGIVPLAGTAALLEYAARDMRVEFIKDVAPHFFEECHRYSKMIYSQFGIESVDKISDWNKEDIVNLLDGIVEAVSSFDVHGSDDKYEELKKYNLGEEAESLVEELAGSLMNFDASNTEEIADKIKNML